MLPYSEKENSLRTITLSKNTNSENQFFLAEGTRLKKEADGKGFLGYQRVIFEINFNGLQFALGKE